MSPPKIIKVSLNEAIKLLEITDIESLSVDELKKIIKKAKNRWHPDRVSHLNDIRKTERYTENFKKVDGAYETLKTYIEGQEIFEGSGFSEKSSTQHTTSESINRQQAKPKPQANKAAQESVYSAAYYQSKLAGIWDVVKKKKYKARQENVVLSEGFSLKELLFQDLSDDLPVLSIISLVYGYALLALLSIPVLIISNFIQFKLEYILVAAFLIFGLCSIVAFLPLSRFWLPDRVSSFVLGVVNIGLNFYNYLRNGGVENGLVMAFVYIPELFAKVIKFLIIYPIYWIVGCFFGHLRVGKIEKNIKYYGDAAEWYVDELLAKKPSDFSAENLEHINIIYDSLKSVKSI